MLFWHFEQSNRGLPATPTQERMLVTTDWLNIHRSFLQPPQEIQSPLGLLIQLPCADCPVQLVVQPQPEVFVCVHDLHLLFLSQGNRSVPLSLGCWAAGCSCGTRQRSSSPDSRPPPLGRPWWLCRLPASGCDIRVVAFGFAPSIICEHQDLCLLIQIKVRYI